MKRGHYDDDTAFTLADDAATVARIVRTVPAERLRTERFDQWTALEVIGHVADMADIFAERVRRMTSEDHPRLVSVDQDAVHAQRHNNDGDPMAFAKRIHASHGEIVRLLADPPNRERIGAHDELGEIDAAFVGAYQADHAHGHVSDLARRFPPTL